MLNETLFPSLAHARATLADWRDDYNVERPHSGIGWQTPNEYVATFAPQRGLTLRPMTSSAPCIQPLVVRNTGMSACGERTFIPSTVTGHSENLLNDLEMDCQ